jgi:hypothetical protein
VGVVAHTARLASLAHLLRVGVPYSGVSHVGMCWG